MKIGILSDLHLGYRQYGLVDREEDFYQQFHKCCDRLNEEDVEMVIIAGDIFDKPNPSPKAMHEYAAGIKNLGNKIVVAIKGNHTMLMKKDHYSVDEFFFDEKNFGNYFLLTDDSMTFENVRVDGITYRAESQLEEFLYEQQEIANEEDVTDIRILVTHQAYQEYCGFFGTDLSIDNLLLEPYDLIINGHIHSHTVDSLYGGAVFLQPGSIERMNTSEALDESQNGKGIWVYDTELNSLKFCPIKCEREFLLGDINIEDEDQLNHEFDRLIKYLDSLDKKPIVSYDYHDYMDKSYLIRDKIASVFDKVLTNNSNIHNEIEEQISVEIQDGELPTVLEALNMVDTDLTDDEKKLAIDIYQATQDGIDIEKLLEDYREKHFNNKKQVGIIGLEDIRAEIQEYEDYFNNL